MPEPEYLYANDRHMDETVAWLDDETADVVYRTSEAWWLQA
jgi:hypothetical protein